MITKNKKTVFILFHVHKRKNQEDDEKIIGVYATKRAGEMAITRAKLLPGFRNFTRGFIIDKYEIGKDHWTEGFMTVNPGQKVKKSQPKDKVGVYKI